MDDGRHHAQQPARALEAIEGAPVLVEPIEEFRMDGIGALHPLPVFELGRLGGELGTALAIEIEKRLEDRIPLRIALGGERLEQPATDDLVALLGGGRPPARLDAPDYVLQTLESDAPHVASEFHVRFRQRGEQQGARHRLHRLAQRLGEGHVGLEATCRQIAALTELAQHGHPLVDQDHAGRRHP